MSTRQSSLVVDPPDGRVPALTAEGRARATARAARGYDSWQDRSLWERCITRGLPMIPGPYNNNYQILQTPDNVVILHEMIHDARIVPLDGRPHVGQNIRQWFGDSRGRWEGNTLVVDTTNFTDKANYRGSTEGLHLIERFTRVDADTVRYEFTIDDPTTFTKKWTVAIPMARTDEQIYEYACHEGNYGMVNLLEGRSRAGKGGGREIGHGFRVPVPVPVRVSGSCSLALSSARPSRGSRRETRRSSQLRRHLELCHHHSARTPRAVEGQSLLYA